MDIRFSPDRARKAFSVVLVVLISVAHAAENPPSTRDKLLADVRAIEPRLLQERPKFQELARQNSVDKVDWQAIQNRVVPLSADELRMAQDLLRGALEPEREELDLDAIGFALNTLLFQAPNPETEELCLCLVKRLDAGRIVTLRHGGAIGHLLAVLVDQGTKAAQDALVYVLVRSEGCLKKRGADIAPNIHDLDTFSAYVLEASLLHALLYYGDLEFSAQVLSTAQGCLEGERRKMTEVYLGYLDAKAQGEPNPKGVEE